MKPKFFQIIFMLSLFSFPSVGQSFTTEVIAPKQFTESIKRTGKLDFKRTIHLSFKSSGYLSRLSVDEGEFFKKGKVLASLDIAELVENKNSTYAQLLQAKRDVVRVEKMVAEKVSSPQELEKALTQVETTRSAYKVAFYNLEKAQVIAPFDGVVLSRHTELGELQSPGKEVLEVAALENNWVVKVTLTGAEVGQVRLGQKVSVLLQNIGQVEGTVSKVPVTANVEGHLFMIEVLLPQLTLKSGVVAGQLAEVTISFDRNDFVYQVPIKALNSVDDEGNALLMTQMLDENDVAQQRFEIYKLDNQFVYLSTQDQAQPLTVITQGWQKLLLGVQ